MTNTDDFIGRMLKGCIQLSSRPNINNTANLVPVDHVARVVVACAFHPPQATMSVGPVTGRPRLRFTQYLAALETYGYRVPLSDYIPWTGALVNYVSRSGKHGSQLALMPLFTFVVNDLPSDTRAPELDDSNAEKALYADLEWTGEDVSAGAGVYEGYDRNISGLLSCHRLFACSNLRSSCQGVAIASSHSSAKAGALTGGWERCHFMVNRLMHVLVSYQSVRVETGPSYDEC